MFGKDQKEHDTRLTAVLKRIEASVATLNPQKCEFLRKTLKFLGHLVDADGVRADPSKTAAIREMSPPTNVPEQEARMGMGTKSGAGILTGER